MKVILRVKDVAGEIHETEPARVSPSERRSLDELVALMGKMNTFNMVINGRERFFNPATLIFAEVVEVLD